MDHKLPGRRLPLWQHRSKQDAKLAGQQGRLEGGIYTMIFVTLLRWDFPTSWERGERRAVLP